MKRIAGLVLVGLLSVCVTETVHACACCLPVAGVRFTEEMSLAAFSADHHRGYALELMEFTGHFVWDVPPDEEDSSGAMLSYADTLFTLRRATGELLAVFAPSGNVEIFWSDAAGGFDAYAEWVFRGDVVEADSSFRSIVSTASLVIQGHQNACFSPDRMVKWVLVLDTGKRQDHLSAFGDIRMDREAWETREYGAGKED